MGNVTLTRISSKLPVTRSWPRPSKDSGRRSPKTSDVTECRTTSYHDPTCGEVCLWLLRQSTAALTSSVCAFLSNMRRNWHAGRPILAVFLHRVGRQRRNFSRAVKFFVEEPHQLLACLSTQHVNIFEVFMFQRMLLSPSNDTRCCAPHFPVRRRTANIRLNCRPCMCVHVLEERAV